MTDLPQVFATEMRRIRVELGMAQESLGAKVGGLDRNSVSRLERDAPNISLFKADAIARALGVSLQSMLCPQSDYVTLSPLLLRDRLHTVRAEFGLSQKELTAQLGVDSKFVRAVEKGNRRVTLELNKANAIAAALGVELREILCPQISSDIPFNERVHSIRTELGLNQRELAEQMGVDRNLVSAVESGGRAVTLRTVQMFAEGLGVKPWDLV